MAGEKLRLDYCSYLRILLSIAIFYSLSFMCVVMGLTFECCTRHSTEVIKLLGAKLFQHHWNVLCTLWSSSIEGRYMVLDRYYGECSIECLVSPSPQFAHIPKVAWYDPLN